MPGYLAIIAGKDEFLVDQDGRACFEKAKKAAGADAVFCKGGDRHAGNIPELTVLRRHGALLIDGLGAKIDSSSRIIAQAKEGQA